MPWDSRHPLYKFGPPHQMGVSTDASTRRSGDSSPCLIREASTFWKGLWPVFSKVQAFFHPCLGDDSHFRFWLDEWTGSRVLQSRFPRLYALVRDRHALVSHYWTNAWVPKACGRLSAPHSLELLDLQYCPAAFQPSETETDRWLWFGAVFSTRAAYRRLGTGSPPNPALTLAACRLIWKRKIPLKVKIFGWLLL